MTAALPRSGNTIAGLDTKGKSFADPVETSTNPKAAGAMQEMAKAFKLETGKPMFITSGNRTLEEQKALHRGWSDEKNKRSTHVHGTGYDINLGGGDKNSSMFKWLRKNGAKYGFRWPGYKYYDKKKKKTVTEWWHWEYHA